MKSTGEVMGRANTFSGAYAKALDAAGMKLPQEGHLFLSIRDEDKAEILNIAKSLSELGFKISATSGTAAFLNRYGIETESVKKLQEGSPNCVEAIRRREYNLVINTASDPKAIEDSFMIRRATLENKIPYFTVVSAARVMAKAIAQERKGPIEVLPL
jgi:carbamoyl-phosphate synthase large subunit